VKIGDHIVPAREAIEQARASGFYPFDRFAGYFLFSNFQGLCRPCHYDKTNEDKLHTGPWPDIIAIERAAPKRVFVF
jgi:5-methylcytosine-specific restriction endonuclease McrA